jgi:PAS domain S-box-containing protein
LYRTVVETSPDGITMSDLDGTIIKSNEAAASIHGYASPDEMKGKNAFDHVAPEEKERVAQNTRRTLETGSIRHVEYRLLRKDGSSFQGELAASVIPGVDGKPRGFVGIVRDIEERKRMQAQLAQTDRMASLGVLAAGVAHEVNNPLTFILYNLENLAQELPKVVAGLHSSWSELIDRAGQEKALRALGPASELCLQGQLDDLVAQAEEAVEGARRVRKIVRDLKSFSLVEDDRRTPLEMNIVIQTALNMAYNEIRYRARVVTDYGRVPRVLANEGRLSQVFLNLLVNAAHAIEEGNVERNEIRVRTWCEDGEVVAEIADTGRGIEPEHRDRLFDPFFTTKRPGVGSGLGLSICHNIVHSYGGRIDVDSDRGSGSRFSVRLPALSDDAMVAGAPKEAKGPDDAVVRGRILLVDDEPKVGTAVKRVLGDEHEVALATSGSEGWEILERDPAFDLIICDLMMPDVSGMDLYHRLADSQPVLARRMVFMTGGAFTPKAQEFQDRVGNVVIEKPFEPEHLKKLVRELLRRESQTPPEPTHESS